MRTATACPTSGPKASATAMPPLSLRICCASCARGACQACSSKTIRMGSLSVPHDASKAPVASVMHALPGVSLSMPRGAPGQRAAAAQSRPGHGEQGFPDLCHRDVPDRLQVDVRKVGHLVGGDDEIDDRRPVDCEHLIDLVV